MFQATLPCSCSVQISSEQVHLHDKHGQFQTIFYATASAEPGAILQYAGTKSIRRLIPLCPLHMCPSPGIVGVVAGRLDHPFKRIVVSVGRVRVLWHLYLVAADKMVAPCGTHSLTYYKGHCSLGKAPTPYNTWDITFPHLYL